MLWTQGKEKPYMLYQIIITWILESGNAQRKKRGLPPLTPTEAKEIYKKFHEMVIKENVGKMSLDDIVKQIERQCINRALVESKGKKIFSRIIPPFLR